MPKHFYYSDPLQAAWMAKHFGMKLDCHYSASDEGIDDGLIGAAYSFREAMICEGDAQMWSDVIASECRRVYIHPDSLHLLDPQVGDVAIVLPDIPDDGEFYHRLKNVGWVNEWCDESETPHDKDVFLVSDGPTAWLGLIRHKRFIRTVQRNGIAFHWPESEKLEPSPV